MHHHHHFRTLFSGRECTIEHCDCGHVHLTLGALTLRFEDETFLQLSDIFQQVSQQLQDLHNHGEILAFPVSARGDA